MKKKSPLKTEEQIEGKIARAEDGERRRTGSKQGGHERDVRRSDHTLAKLRTNKQC